MVLKIIYVAGALLLLSGSVEGSLWCPSKRPTTKPRTCQIHCDCPKRFTCLVSPTSIQAIEGYCVEYDFIENKYYVLNELPYEILFTMCTAQACVKKVMGPGQHAFVEDKDLNWHQKGDVQDITSVKWELTNPPSELGKVGITVYLKPGTLRQDEDYSFVISRDGMITGVKPLQVQKIEAQGKLSLLKTGDKGTILEYAQTLGHSEIIEFFASKKDAFISAVKTGNASAIQQLLNDGFTLFVHQRDPQTQKFPLILAIENKAPEIVKLLLQAGADPNAKDPKTQKTPFILAAEKKAPEILKLLVRSGANVVTLDPQGNTALLALLKSLPPRSHRVPDPEAYATAEVIIGYFGPYTFTPDQQGNTALTLAINNYHDPIIREILKQPKITKEYIQSSWSKATQPASSDYDIGTMLLEKFKQL